MIEPETRTTSGTPTLRRLQLWLEHPRLPLVLALGAVLFMLPALNTGLVFDDLLQRLIALPPSEVPQQIRDIGFPPDSGSLPTVTRDFFFGSYRDPERVALARNYGVFPWWTPPGLSLGLWRPLTAFTHWLDYQLYPDSPTLMHAQNIAWFATAVFLAASFYRKVMSVGWAAGLAGLFFLLDANTYFPVAFVANRGFILSLCLGLACLHQHHKWRAQKRPSGLIGSALFLALSVLANEGGASTLAFILAYALVLESGGLRQRAVSILPSFLVIVVWRIAYWFADAGVCQVGGYIDPTREPLLFLHELFPRFMILLGGQLTHVAPELALAVKPELQAYGTALFALPVIGSLILFAPGLRRNKPGTFWLVVMLLAAIPAATVVPLSKNLGFVAVGAYGWIASLLAASFRREGSECASSIYGTATRAICVLFLLLHGPVALAGRVLVTAALNPACRTVSTMLDIGNPAGVQTKQVVVINSPSTLALAYIPFERVHSHLPLPRSLRMLVPGCTNFEVTRPDATSLMVESKGLNIFSCDDVGPIHFLYLVRYSNVFIGEAKFKKGQRFEMGDSVAEILELGADNLPSRVLFRFKDSLDSPVFHWLQFNCQTRTYEPFHLPAVGQQVTVAGPVP